MRGGATRHGHSPFDIMTVSGLKQSARQPSLNNCFLLNGNQTAARISNTSTRTEMLYNTRLHLRAFLTKELNSIPLLSDGMCYSWVKGSFHQQHYCEYVSVYQPTPIFPNAKTLITSIAANYNNSAWKPLLFSMQMVDMFVGFKQRNLYCSILKPKLTKLMTHVRSRHTWHASVAHHYGLFRGPSSKD